MIAELDDLYGLPQPYDSISIFSKETEDKDKNHQAIAAARPALKAKSDMLKRKNVKAGLYAAGLSGKCAKRFLQNR